MIESVTYPASLIASIQHMDSYQEILTLKKERTLSHKDLTFVNKHQFHNFIQFMDQLEYLFQENRLDHIQSITSKFDEIIFINEFI